MGAKKTQAHCHAGNAQALRHFLSGTMHDIEQQAHAAQIGRQFQDGRGKKAAGFIAKKTLFRIGEPGRKLGTEGFFGTAAGLIERKNFSFAPAPDDVNGGICGNAGNPGMQLVMRAGLCSHELIEAAERFQQRFLANILCIEGISVNLNPSDTSSGAYGMTSCC